MKKRAILTISLIVSILLAFLLISGCASDAVEKEEPKSEISENATDTCFSIQFLKIN